MKINYTRPASNRKVKRERPYHRKKHAFEVHLSKDLRAKYQIRSLPVRRMDTVLILKGKYAGLQKKVSHLSFKKGKIQIEGVKTTKTDGTEIFHYIEPSNCVLMELGDIDSGRQKILDRKTGSSTKAVNEEEEL